MSSWSQLLIVGLGGGAIGSTITTYVTWNTDRRKCRGQAVRQISLLISKALHHTSNIKKSDPTESLNEVETALADAAGAALLAGVSKERVDYLIKLFRIEFLLRLSSLETPSELGGYIWDLMSVINNELWHPWRSHLSLRRRREWNRVKPLLENDISKFSSQLPD